MTPQRVTLGKARDELVLHYADGTLARLSAEYLRVESPSAEVRGHGPGQEVLQYGKARVRIERIEAAGRYALQIHFDDGHNTGIYSWDYLRELWDQREARWQRYLERLHQAGRSRDPEVQVVRLVDPRGAPPKSG
ncbi:MAG: gamma-butyrobetaine hydroxylase-like domain-containing protein [Pseudomonadota bacterium]